MVAADEDGRPITLQGTIVAVDRHSIVLHLDRIQRDVRVLISPRTEIKRNGRPARLSDLQVRDLARARAEIVRTPRGLVLYATTIAARGK